MDTIINEAGMVSALFSHLDWVKSFLKNLEDSRIQVAMSAMHNEREVEAAREGLGTFDYEGSVEGNSMSWKRVEKDDSLMLDLLEKGKPDPKLGGHGGTVTGVYGEKYKSNVDPKDWGKKTNLGWDPQAPAEEAHTIAKDTLPPMISDSVPEATSDIIEQGNVKESIAQLFQRNGGGS